MPLPQYDPTTPEGKFGVYHIHNLDDLHAQGCYQRVMAWFDKHGVPRPVEMPYADTMGVPTIKFVWYDAQGNEKAEEDAAAFLSSPYTAQDALLRGGIIPAFIQYPDPPDPTQDPRPNNPPVQLRPAAPGQPIGNGMFANTGSMPTEGQKASDPRGTFTAHIYYPTPMGASAYWTLDTGAQSVVAPAVSAPAIPQPRIPAVQTAAAPLAATAAPLDPNLLALLKMVLADHPEILAAVLAAFGSQPAPPPPPAPIVFGVHPFTTSGRALAPVDTVTEPEARGKVIVNGPAGQLLGWRLWTNGAFFLPNGDQGKASVLPLSPYRFDANGVCTVNGTIIQGGPSIYERQSVVKTEFWAAPYGTDDWVQLGAYELTVMWEPGLAQSRAAGPLTWDPYIHPYLCSDKYCPARWKAVELGISEDEYKAIQNAVDNGLPIPQNPRGGFAPGTPQT